MNSDDECVGICMIDPDTGVCMGCGRTSEEIFGIPTPPPPPEPTAAAKTPPLPPAVQAEVGSGSD